MLWPPFARMAWYLFTWEYLALLITLCAPCAAAWIEVVHGSFQLWLIVECGRRHDSKQEVKAAKWKRRHRKGPVARLEDSLGRFLDTAITYLDRLVTWAVGNEPTTKERLTWTAAGFRNQRRVRKGLSSGQGYNKRSIGTSSWHRTAAIICLVATTGRAEMARFDSDSYVIHVDNCASRCITHSLSDFVRPPQKVVGRVKGMGGDKVAVSAVGTIRWTFDDDDGMTHAFLIPGSLYIPESPARLFSPQHWAQERKDDLPKKNGTWQATFADHVKLVWGQEAYQKRIPLDKSNVASFTTTAGCKEFRVFRACLEETDDDLSEEGSFKAFDATLIVDDEDDDFEQDQEDGRGPEDDESIAPIPQPRRSVRGGQSAEDPEDIGYDRTTGHHDTSYERYKTVATIEDIPEDAFEGKMKPTSEILL